MKPVKPIVSGTVSALPLLDLPGQEIKAEKARRAGMFDLDPAERSYFDIANGSRKASYGTDTLVAKAMATSATLSLEGVIRDVEHWTQARSPQSLTKLIRGLQHANKEMDELAASRDVQIERWSLSEVGINVHQGYLFRELSELHARFGELLEAIGRSPLEELARFGFDDKDSPKEAKQLFLQLSKLLTEPHTLESHVLWHARPEGDELTPMQAIFPVGTDSTENLKDAYRKHLDAETLLAKGEYVEAIEALLGSARALPAGSPNQGYALVYLADALVLTGLRRFDTGALYHAGVLNARSHTKPDDEDLGRLVAHVHAQLQDTGRHELATQTTREALGSKDVLHPSVRALIGE